MIFPSIWMELLPPKSYLVLCLMLLVSVWAYILQVEKMMTSIHSNTLPLPSHCASHSWLQSLLRVLLYSYWNGWCSATRIIVGSHPMFLLICCMHKWKLWHQKHLPLPRYFLPVPQSVQIPAGWYNLDRYQCPLWPASIFSLIEQVCHASHMAFGTDNNSILLHADGLNKTVYIAQGICQWGQLSALSPSRIVIVATLIKDIDLTCLVALSIGTNSNNGTQE